MEVVKKVIDGCYRENLEHLSITVKANNVGTQLKLSLVKLPLVWSLKLYLCSHFFDTVDRNAFDQRHGRDHFSKNVQAGQQTLVKEKQ